MKYRGQEEIGYIGEVRRALLDVRIDSWRISGCTVLVQNTFSPDQCSLSSPQDPNGPIPPSWSKKGENQST
jgi:hypothetical protein